MCVQVTDFLSGKAPLNLTMRLGDHMMLIQLQLSTVSPVQHHSSRNHFTALRRGYSSSSSNSSSSNSSQQQISNQQASQNSSVSTSARHHSSRHHNHHRNSSTSSGAARHHHHHHGHHYHHSHPYYHHPFNQYHLLPQPHATNTNSNDPRNVNVQPHQQIPPQSSPPAHQNSAPSSGKANSNLVSSTCNSSTASSHPLYFTPPRRSSSGLYAPNYSPQSSSSSSSSASPSSPSATWSPCTPTNPAPQHSQAYPQPPASSLPASYNHTTGSLVPLSSQSSAVSSSDLPVRVCPHSSMDEMDCLPDVNLESSSVGEDLSFSSSRRAMAGGSLGGRVRGVSAVGLDTKALAEASRNLTQTLRQLSSEVLTNKPASGAQQQKSSQMVSIFLIVFCFVSTMLF